MKIHEIDIYRNAIDVIAKTIPSLESRVLITGASGLIGSILVDVLARANQINGANFKIYALGRNEKRLRERFCYSEDIHIMAQDVAEPIRIEGLDYILHTASAADPNSYAEYPVETILTNVQGSGSILEYCRGRKTRAIMTSTFEVYGKLEKDTYAEEDFGLIDENQLRSVYPESKRVAELLFRGYHKEYGVDCMIARLPSVFGPTMSEKDNKAHAEFLRNAAYGKEIILKSEGHQKRNYTYVLDIVRGLFFLLQNGQSGEVYNVANKDTVISIADFAKTVAEIAGVNITFQQISRDEQKKYSNPHNVLLTTDKINQLGWDAVYGLRKGVEDTLSILKQLG